MDVTTAHGPLYTSGTFWAIAGVVVAAAAIVVSAILWQRQSPKRLLTFSLVSQTALLSKEARKQAGPELEVTLRGDPLNDPHVTAIRIQSRSRRDIRGSDFENGDPLRFGLGSPVLRTLAADTGGDDMPKIPVGTEGSAVLVGPALIKRGQVISIDLLTDGPVKLTCPNPSLADVTVRETRPSEGEPLARRRTDLIGFGLIIASIGIIGSIDKPANKVPALVVVTVTLAFIFGIFLILSSIIGRNWNKYKKWRSTRTNSTGNSV